MIKYSIIIPVYNTGDFLKPCIASVQAQENQNWEILLIDDGSSDNSAEICREVAKAEPRIRFFSQENQGQLKTRQNGILTAEGEYVLFLDSDDTWNPQLLDRIEETIEAYGCDMVLFGYQKMKDGRVLRVSPQYFSDCTVFEQNKKELARAILEKGAFSSVWVKAIHRNLALQCIDGYDRYWHIRQSEDLLQSLRWFAKARRIVYIHDVLYNYIWRNSSVTNTSAFNRYKDMLLVQGAVKEFGLTMGIRPEELMPFYKNVCRRLLVYISGLCRAPGPCRPSEDFLNEIYGHPFLEEVRDMGWPDTEGWSFKEKYSFRLFFRQKWRGLIQWETMLGRLRDWLAK